MRAIGGVVRNYDWGSRSAIAQLRGMSSPTSKPEAELWFGTHPTAPSPLEEGGMLNEEVQLPFLVKVLAAQRPLSLQAHPSAEQARIGFAREESQPGGGPRNYVDPNPKPEILVALTEFSALCGFRQPMEAARILRQLEVESLMWLVEVLQKAPASLALREAVTQLLGSDRSSVADMITQSVKSAEVMGADHPDAQAFTVLQELASHYPDDPGVLVAMLLEHVVLQPGEALYMPPGHIHAYLRGMGVEVMTASDNVLRGGLTSKHVDVPELLRVVQFSPLGDPRRASVTEESQPGVSWTVESSEFRLRHVTVENAPLSVTPNGPRIVLCVVGTINVADEAGSVSLSAGEAAFSSPNDGAIEASGTGEFFLVSP